MRIPFFSYISHGFDIVCPCFGKGKIFSVSLRTVNKLCLFEGVYTLFKKMFLMLYSINRPNFLLLEILVNMSMTIVCDPGFDVIKLEINLIFLIKTVFYMTKNSRQKFKYLEIKTNL